jgi:predicted RNase H-like HicB family nuclease
VPAAAQISFWCIAEAAILVHSLTGADNGDWHVAYCPEIPGANGQGRTKDEARASLAEAIALILEDRREDSLRGVPADAERDTVIVE